MRSLVFDIETDDLKATKVWCIVAQDLDSNELFRFAPHQLESGLELLQSADRLIGHNIIGFDIPVIKKIYPWFKPKGRVVDTLLLSRLYHADMLEVDRKTKPSGMPPKLYGRHSLESYGYRLGEYKGDFGQTSDWLEWSKEMEDYCVQDTIVTKKLCQHFHPYLIGSN